MNDQVGMKIEVGAYEAMTKLPGAPAPGPAGKRFRITNRGKPVAELGPPGDLQRPNAEAALEAFQHYRTAHPMGHPVDIWELIEEGRE